MANRNPQTFKYASINICGLSNRSKLVINKYIVDEGLDLLSVQETGSDNASTLELLNMSVICDTNGSTNKGAALYIRNKHSITNLESISQLSKNLDSCWGLVVAQKKRFIFGNVYVKLNHKAAIPEVMKMLAAAKQKQTQLKASGIILTGDFNARHQSWGDSSSNYYGKILAESLNNTDYSICTSQSPTFLCSNGSSFIDLNIVSNNLAESIHSCRTDEEVELFSGAPARGHVPLITELIIRENTQTTVVKEKLDVSKMNWENWSSIIENEIEDNYETLNSSDSPYTLWHQLNHIITKATDICGSYKKSCQHSKPYWTNDLSALSHSLRSARKNYIKRNTDANLQKLNEAKVAFDTGRKSACQDFLIDKAKNLNSTQAANFWKEFNKIFKKKSVQKIDPLISDSNDLLTDTKDIENCLFSVFFEGKHLINGDFDDIFYHEVTNLYELVLNEEPEMDEVLDTHLNGYITRAEILKAIKSNGKSVDNSNFHPNMFKHLGNNALALLEKLFNLCLSTRKWVWEGAEVIFLRKDGKDSYSKPGSYRPICITAYIGKLLESILARRIEALLLSKNLTDPDQEGFSAHRNAIRYLSRLHLGISADKEKCLTVLCLFIDFEKAFDSVWKKGLILKLSKIGIQGNILHLINNFLFTRKVALNINGVVGEERLSAEYGLPQGSVLSPPLFKIFLMDFLTDLNHRTDIDLYKFADDGSIKVTAQSSTACIEKLNYVLKCIHEWTRKWKMKVNCDRNKTEVICFNSAENNKNLIPESFKLGDKSIKRVTETKVLGLIIDENLSYKQHSEAVLKSLHHRWNTLCKYSNRHWGFTQNVMMYLLKALFLSKLSYGSHIWMTKNNMRDINKLWYHILKSSVGAVLNINQSIAEVILGIPPIQLQTTVNGIKHLLKINNQQIQNDRYREFLNSTYDVDTKSPLTIYHKFKDVYKFLSWKMNLYPEHFTDEDLHIVNSRQYGSFLNLTEKSCTYTKSMMKRFTNKMWQNVLSNQFQLDGYASSPTPSSDRLPVPLNTPRNVEVLLMSMFYKNNILNQSLWNLGKVPSPLCTACLEQEETAHHIIFQCSAVDEELRARATHHYRLANNLEEGQADPDSFIGLLNASRDELFIRIMIDIINTLHLRVTVEL
jgi:hypothetical protein